MRQGGIRMVRSGKQPDQEKRKAARRSRINRNNVRKLQERICMQVNPLSEWIFKRLSLGKQQSVLNRELSELSSGKRRAVHDYYIQKLTELILLCGAAACALIVLILISAGQNTSLGSGILKRPSYGEPANEESLNLQIEGQKESEVIGIRLDARQYSVKQVQEYLKAAQKQLLLVLPGENKSTGEVRRPLCFQGSFQKGKVKAEYESAPFGLIDEKGCIVTNPPEEGILAEITVTLTCQKRSLITEIPVRVYPPVLTKKELEIEKIKNAVLQAAQENPTLPEVRLPAKAGEKKLSWYRQKDGLLRGLMLFILLLPPALWFHRDSQIKEKAKERRDQLELDYSQMLWKMTMLLGAGITIRGAFTRISAQYAAQKKEPRFVYEEMILTLREMNSGVPEAAAYENFGRRCAVPAYIKLGSLLAQNLKKGSRGLNSLLEKEAVLSMEQQKNAVKKMGEKAGLKMLLPMLLMFMVVLIILVVPAFLSME